jgi:hypothetical protein
VDRGVLVGVRWSKEPLRMISVYVGFADAKFEVMTTDTERRSRKLITGSPISRVN